MKNAFAYLRPRAGYANPQAAILFGPEKDFLKLRHRLAKAGDALAARESAIVSRWMAEATTWGDYFEGKEMNACRRAEGRKQGR